MRSLAAPTPQGGQFTDVADVYDSLMSGVPYAEWLTYVEQLWELMDLTPRRILDLACGTANVTTEFVQAGYDVEGLDNSAAMLERARRKLPYVPFHLSDAAEFQLDRPLFDACVCLFDSLNYLLTPERLRSSFECVRRHLAPGGSFLFDLNTVYALRSGMFNQRGHGVDSALEFRWSSRWDEESLLCTIEMEFFHHREVGTRIVRETHIQRGFPIPELESLLRDAGFQVLGIYDGFTFRTPRARSDRIHILAVNPAS